MVQGRRNPRTETEKWCPGCKSMVLLTGFSKNRSMPDGLQTYCQPCSVSSARAYHKRYPEKHRAYNNDWDRRNPEKKKDAALKGRLGVEAGTYSRLYAEQNGACAICGWVNTNRRLAVDHCKLTGVIRKLLCSPCNTGIGQFHHSKEKLLKAIQYLDETAAHPTLPEGRAERGS